MSGELILDFASTEKCFPLRPSRLCGECLLNLRYRISIANSVNKTLSPEYCMSDRDERPKKRRRQGAEDFLAEDILRYFAVRKFFCNAAYGGLYGLVIDLLMQYSG